MNTTHPQATLIQECIDAIDNAVRQFGSYSYNDKGPHEVMDVDELKDKIQNLTPEAAASVLRSVANAKGLDVDPCALSEAIVMDLQHWDALFEQPGIEDICGGETPEMLEGDLQVAAGVGTKKKRKP